MSLDFCCDIQKVGIIWRKEHESMDPSCLVSMVQAGGGGVMVWGIFSWHTLGPLVPIEHCLNTTAWVLLLTMSIPLWLQCTHLLMATSSRIMHHVAKLKSSQTGFTHDNEFFTLLKRTPQSPDLNPIEHLWDVVEREIHIMDVLPTKSAATVWCYHVNMDQTIWGMFPTPCWIYATKNQGSSEGKKGSNPVLARCT